MMEGLASRRRGKTMHLCLVDTLGHVRSSMCSSSWISMFLKQYVKFERHFCNKISQSVRVFMSFHTY